MRPIGAGILAVECGGIRGVTVWDRASGDCGYDEQGRPKPACADTPLVQGRSLLGLYVTPLVPTYYDDDQQTLIVHELGHNLGFDHWPDCDSIMNAGSCIYDFLVPEPQPVDMNNYGTAYYVDPPTGLTGSSTSPNTVVLSWNADNIHNEALFYIEKAPGGTENWAWIDTAGQNHTGKTLTSQEAGSWRYKVGGWTGAWCNEATRRVVAHGQQIHGGIGFTKDYKIQLYFRRQKMAELMWGDSDYHRELVAQSLEV